LIVRAFFTLIVIFLGYKIYQRLFRQKRCIACGKMIFKEAAICHHCNTIQEGVELVQAKVETGSAPSGNQRGQKDGGQRGILLFGGVVILIALGVASAVWWFQSA